MNILIVGTGGLGGYFGGMLKKSGADVTFLSRGKTHKALIKEGLHLTTVDEEFHLTDIKVVDSASMINAPDLVILTTKTYDLLDISHDLQNANIKDDTIIITLQNGLDNDLIVQNIIKKGMVYPGVVYIVSEQISPATYKQSAGPRTLFFGDRNSKRNDSLFAIEDLLRKSNINATLSEDINEEVWSKYLWITSFAGITSLCRSPIGPIVNDQDSYNLTLDCLTEGFLVAEQEKVFKNPSAVKEKIIKKFDDYKTIGTHAKSSMLIDIENKRRTEIEALNGELVRRAKLSNVHTPINNCIYSSVKIASKYYLSM